MTTTIELTDQVQLKFLGWPEGHPQAGQPLRLMWNSREYAINQGQQRPVPFEMVKMYFGDPRASDVTQSIKDEFGGPTQFVSDRLTQVRLLQQFWIDSSFATRAGAIFRELIPGDRTQLTAGISDRIPPVEVYTLDGERIYTVVDDPYGDQVIAAVPTRSDRDALAALNARQSDQIQRLEDEMRELKDMMRNQQAQYPGAPVDLGPDLPIGKPSPAFADAPGPESPALSVAEEAPKMVLNPRTGRVSKKRDTIPEPRSVEDLQADL